jgi:hypothetical protein
VGKIANATVEKWTTALNMILKRGHDFYPQALKVPLFHSEERSGASGQGTEICPSHLLS